MAEEIVNPETGLVETEVTPAHEGTKETEEVIALIGAGFKVFKAAKQDGKIDLADLKHLATLLPALGPAFNKISKAPAELKDLDSAELESLAAKVSEAAGLEGGTKAALIAKQGLAIALAAYQIFKLSKVKKA